MKLDDEVSHLNRNNFLYACEGQTLVYLMHAELLLVSSWSIGIVGLVQIMYRRTTMRLNLKAIVPCSLYPRCPSLFEL